MKRPQYIEPLDPFVTEVLIAQPFDIASERLARRFVAVLHHEIMRSRQAGAVRAVAGATALD